MEDSEKPLRTTSFIVHATRGVIRDQRTRRLAMLVCLSGALLLLIAGFTVLQTWLNPREHPWPFVLFWVACGWLTFSAMLLALFDMLMLRLEARRQQRALRQRAGESAPAAEPSPSGTLDP
jgi:biotin transporter BioY